MSEERVEYLYRLLGVKDLAEGIANIEAERQGMRELHDENTALKIYNRRLRLVVDYAMRVFGEIESASGVFLPEKVRGMIVECMRQVALADKALKESKALSEKEIPSRPERV
jgi:hypothetical protein